MLSSSFRRFITSTPQVAVRFAERKGDVHLFGFAHQHQQRILSSTFLSTLKSNFHTSSLVSAGVKTKQAAAKRLLKTSKGGIKYGHAGKRHLNRGKSQIRMRRLGKMGRLSGTWEKKMNKLLIS